MCNGLEWGLLLCSLLITGSLLLTGSSVIVWVRWLFLLHLAKWVLKQMVYSSTKREEARGSATSDVPGLLLGVGH